MENVNKKTQLKKYKWIATGLFLFMASIFIITTILQKENNADWIGYVRAFSEAAMVGALADWFAVTALFHYPMGLKIPHTNLIQNSKEKIGDNLGNFIVDNFLSPKNIRPYILKLKIAHLIGNWLHQEKNQNILIRECSAIILDVLSKIENKTATKFIEEKLKNLSQDTKPNILIGNGLDYLIDKNIHQQFISYLSLEIKKHLDNHQEIVRERVQKESYSFIPKFIDNSIADKITQGIIQYFNEIQQDSNHAIRLEITQKLKKFSIELKTDTQWEQELNSLKNNLLESNKLQTYAEEIWNSIQNGIHQELYSENSSLKIYIKKNINIFAKNLQKDELLQYKIDHWARTTAYKYILKHRHHFGGLISSTMGNWEGRELSQKLELEVGKDLQYIRINGTIVGGLVGLLLYTIVHLLG